jgi:hypothetical protein
MDIEIPLSHEVVVNEALSRELKQNHEYENSNSDKELDPPTNFNFGLQLIAMEPWGGLRSKRKKGKKCKIEKKFTH